MQIAIGIVHSDSLVGRARCLSSAIRLDIICYAACVAFEKPMANEEIDLEAGVSQADRVKSTLRQLFDPSRFDFPAAVSLTMKKQVGSRSIDMMVASENFRHFRNRLNSKILGSKAKLHGGKLKMVAIIESNADGRLHYHAMIDRPYYCSFDRFKDTVIDQWQRTDFGYRQIDIQDAADSGWIDYIIKPQQKRSLLDSIDWTNCQLIAE